MEEVDILLAGHGWDGSLLVVEVVPHISSRLYIYHLDVRDCGVPETYDGEVVRDSQAPFRYILAKGMVPAAALLRRYIAVAVEETQRNPAVAAVGVEVDHTSAVVVGDCRTYLGLYLVRFGDLGDIVAAAGYNTSQVPGANYLVDAGGKMIVVGCSMCLCLGCFDYLLTDKMKAVLALRILGYSDCLLVGRMRVALALYTHLDVVRFQCSQSCSVAVAPISKSQPVKISSRDTHMAGIGPTKHASQFSHQTILMSIGTLRCLS